MKKIQHWRFWMVIAVYILGLVLGGLVILGIPYYQRQSDLKTLVTERGEYFAMAGADADEPEDIPLFGMAYFFVNEEGEVLHQTGSFLMDDAWHYISDEHGRLFEKGNLFKMSFLVLDSLGSTSRMFALVVGKTVTDTQGNIYGSLIVRDLANLDTSLFSYAILYTAMFLCAVFFTRKILNEEWELQKMRRDLVANVSHELKTPITTIRATAEVLYDDMAKDIDARHKYCSLIMQESDYLEKLVLDIIELSRLQSHSCDLNKCKCHADDVFTPTIERYIMLCQDIGIRMDVEDLNLEQIPPLDTNPDKMVTLLDVLLNNAVKFSGVGGHIQLSHKLYKDHVVFCVQDDGPGIESDDIERIFERFYKSDVAHNSSGSGLGLAIGQEIAHCLDERLWVESHIGSGSRFYFTIHLFKAA